MVYVGTWATTAPVDTKVQKRRSGGLIGVVEKNFRMCSTGSFSGLNFTIVGMIENFAVILACQNESKVVIYSMSTRSLSVDSSPAEC